MGNPRKKPQLGEVMGQWTITDLPGTVDAYGNLRVECTCSCGKVRNRSYYHFRSGRSKHCGCSTKWRTPDLRGRTFNKLFVESRAAKSSGNIKWLCKCVCSASTKVATGDLIYGKTQQCRKCGIEESRLKHLIPHSGFTKLIRAYRISAETRNYSWSLSDDEARSLFESDCYYCGKPPAQISRHTPRSVAYVYNGIDRLVNSDGYVIDNCVACCKWCNQAKSDLSVEAFLSSVHAIAARHPCNK